MIKGQAKFTACTILLYVLYLYRQESNPVVSSSPVKIIILWRVYLVYCRPCGKWKFLAVRWVNLGDPSWVSCWPSVSRPRDLVMCENQRPPPLPAVWAWTAYLTPLFRLNPQIPLRCYMDFWLPHCFSPIYPFINIEIFPFCNFKFGAYSWRLFLFSTVVLSLVGYLLPF